MAAVSKLNWLKIQSISITIEGAYKNQARRALLLSMLPDNSGRNFYVEHIEDNIFTVGTTGNGYDNEDYFENGIHWVYSDTSAKYKKASETFLNDSLEFKTEFYNIEEGESILNGNADDLGEFLPSEN